MCEQTSCLVCIYVLNQEARGMEMLFKKKKKIYDIGQREISFR